MSFRVFNSPLAKFLYSHGFILKAIRINGSGTMVKFADREDREQILKKYQEIKRRRFIDGKRNRYSNTG